MPLKKSLVTALIQLVPQVNQNNIFAIQIAGKPVRFNQGLGAGGTGHANPQQDGKEKTLYIKHDDAPYLVMDSPRLTHVNLGNYGLINNNF